MTLQNKFTRETPGAQLHMLINIPVKFHDPRSNISELHVTQNENGQMEGQMEGQTDKGKSKYPLKWEHNKVH
jgi:hypothetical protein